MIRKQFAKYDSVNGLLHRADVEMVNVDADGVKTDMTEAEVTSKVAQFTDLGYTLITKDEYDMADEELITSLSQ